jgi:3-oxoacyl-[acyl-carrier protein] reductase
MSGIALSGRNAVVIRGSRGIGRAIALRLAEAGANVVLTYRERLQDAQCVVRDIEAKGRLALALQMEVTERASIEAAAKEARRVLGPIAILVNNARTNKPTDFDKVGGADWDEIVATNLKGPFLCSQIFLPLLAESKNGAIVHVGSVSSQSAGPRAAHCAASEAGLTLLAQVIARFGAKDGVRSNVVAAGLIAFDVADAQVSAAAVQKAADDILLKRLGTANEVADAVAFLASDASSYITAQTLNVNGGLYF